MKELSTIMKFSGNMGVILLAVFILTLLGIGSIFLLDGESNTPELGDSTGDNKASSDAPDGDDGDDSATGDTDTKDGDNGFTGEDENENTGEKNVPDVEISPSIEVKDLGPVQAGEMQLINETSGETVATHDFEEGHNTTFDNVNHEHEYELVIEAPVAPPEVVSSIEPNATWAAEFEIEIGDDFQTADSFAAEFELENERGVFGDGYTAYNSNGNYIAAWDDPGTPERYKTFHYEQDSNTYTTLGQGEWYDRNSNINPLANDRPSFGLESLIGIEDREFLGETTSPYNDEIGIVHEYRVEPTEFRTEYPMNVHVDPETGYVMYVDFVPEGPEGTEYSDTWFILHDEPVDVIPDSFPIHNPP